MTWNCKSSSFYPSERLLRSPALSPEKAVSSGARIVSPPDFVVRSCKLSWLINWVVFMRRIRTLNDLLAFLRIPMMSTAATVSGVAALPVGDCGNEGTNGLGAAAGGVAAAGCVNWAKVVVEYKRGTSSVASEKDKRDCFFSIILVFDKLRLCCFFK